MDAMRLDVFRHLWGVIGDGGPYASAREAFPAIADTGLFAGIESPILLVPDRSEWADLLAEHGFDYIPMLFTFGATVDDHLSAFRSQIETANELQHRIMVSHSGRDAWPYDDARRFFEEATKIERDLGATVAHETHRSRVLFNPWVTDQLLADVPDLKLNADYSHWVVVGERLLDDAGDVLARCAGRAIHVHARVGYEHGPQVTDPRSPEWEPHLVTHERWWDQIWEAARERGDDAVTLTPEFGPPTYLHTLPNTNEPVADLWDICTWMAERQQMRFAASPG
jgi:hypothetical protein